MNEFYGGIFLSGYQRFIAYVYEYQKGKKAENCGFLKVEIKNSSCRIELHLHCPGLPPQMEAQIYAFFRKDGLINGILLGSCNTAADMAECILECDSANLAYSGISFEQVGGIIIRTQAGGFYGTEWDDLPVRPDDFREISLRLPASPSPEKPEDSASPDHAADAPQPVTFDGSSNDASDHVSDSPQPPSSHASPDSSEPYSPEDNSDKAGAHNFEDSVDTPKKPDFDDYTDVPQKPDLNRSIDVPKEPGFNDSTDVPRESGFDRSAASPKEPGFNDSTDVPREPGFDRSAASPKEPGFNDPTDVPRESGFDRSAASPKEPDFDRPPSESRIQSLAPPEIASHASGSRSLRESPSKEKAPTNVEADFTVPKRQPCPFPGKEFTPFDDADFLCCMKIHPNDLMGFPPCTRALRNNRFLQYGFYHFGHLLLGVRPGGRYILGVPGSYDQQERFMANMFGFPYFRESRLIHLPRNRGGYWYRSIDAPNLH